MPLLAAIPLASAIGSGAGAIAGGVKAKLAGDQANRERKLAAETQRYSPWTDLKAEPVQEANPVGDVVQGVTGGGMFGQSLGGANAPKFDTKTGASLFDPSTGKKLGEDAGSDSFDDIFNTQKPM